MNQVDGLIAALQERRGWWPKVAQDAAVSYSWLVKFAGGRIKNPRIQTVDRLARALEEKPYVAG